MSRPLRAKEEKTIPEILGYPIAYYPVFEKIGGSVEAALLLSQAYHWSKNIRAIERDGWFYKSHVQWTQETNLTRRAQQTARKHLRERGLLEEKDGSLPGKGRVLWFRVNLNALTAALTQLADEASAVPRGGIRRVAPQRPTPLHENAQPVAPQRPTCPITSETTPTTTAKTTRARRRHGDTRVVLFERPHKRPQKKSSTEQGLDELRELREKLAAEAD